MKFVRVPVRVRLSVPKGLVEGDLAVEGLKGLHTGFRVDGCSGFVGLRLSI